MPLFGCKAMFLAIPFNCKEFVAVNYALYSRMGIVQLLALRNGIMKIPANTRPTAGARDSRQMIVALVAIRHEVSAKSLQEGLGIVPGAGFRISIEDDWRQAILAGSEEPHKRICFRLPIRLFEHLNPCLIRHQESTLQQQPVEVLINGVEVFI